MRIPSYCGSTEFHQSLSYNRKKIDDVLERFESGGFNEVELEELAMAAGRTSLVCRELVKWRHLKTSVESVVAAQQYDDDIDAFCWD
jgi:hypothetical protein